MLPAVLGILAALLLAGASSLADDWPQFNGPSRDAVWRETETISTLPPEGLEIRWRAAVGGGLSSPVVAQGRVYVFDSAVEKPKAWERLHCFDEQSGRELWTHSYEVEYPEWAFDPKAKTGPGSTPIVAGGKVFTLGASSQCHCLDAQSGAVLWRRDLTKDYSLEAFENTTPSPLIDGERLILVIGGKPDACVVALDLATGKEIWRALADTRTYSSPIIITAGGQRQLIVWTPAANTSLNPVTGQTWWRELRSLHGDFAVAAPTYSGDLLLAGGLMFQLNPREPKASVLWPEDTVKARRTLSQTSGPLLKDGYIYTHKMQGHLVCLEARTGRQVWDREKIVEAKGGACLHLIAQGEIVWLYTDQGDLIQARLSPTGYEEVGCAYLLNPTYAFGGRDVLWIPPAFANRHIIARNDEEVICASLEARP